MGDRDYKTFVLLLNEGFVQVFRWGDNYFEERGAVKIVDLIAMRR